VKKGHDLKLRLYHLTIGVAGDIESHAHTIKTCQAKFKLKTSSIKGPYIQT